MTYSGFTLIKQMPETGVYIRRIFGVTPDGEVQIWYARSLNERDLNKRAADALWQAHLRNKQNEKAGPVSEPA